MLSQRSIWRWLRGMRGNILCNRLLKNHNHRFSPKPLYRVTKTSEHVFFDLEKAKECVKYNFLKQHQYKNPLLENYLSGLKEILKSWDISRDEPYFGFKIPGEKDKYFYVWVDAPIGYMASASHWAAQQLYDQ